jgi:cell division control protein 6
MTESHATSVSPIVGREAERRTILDFVETCERSNKGRTMYICGSPGVGKTLSVQNVMNAWQKDRSMASNLHSRRYSYVNIIGIHDHFKVFSFIESLVKGKSFASRIKRKRGDIDPGETFAQLSDCVESVISAAHSSCAKPTTCVVVLDEIDYLCPSLSAVTRGGSTKTSAGARRQFELVSALLTLPRRLEGSLCTLIIIGIANSIDLSTKLSAMSTSSRATRGREPLIESTLIFRPYTATELKSILAETTDHSIDQVAAQFCAQKVARLNGDCRKIIDICKQAKSRRIQVDGTPSASAISINDLGSVFSKAYKSQSESTDSLRALPQQQLLVLVAACRHALSHPERVEFVIGDLRSALALLIKELNIPSTGTNQMASLMEHALLLSNSGLMSVKLPSGIKQRVATWRLNGPVSKLEETLRYTTQLVASALSDPISVRE